MVKIEQTRKELEEYADLSDIFNKDDGNDNYNKGRLSGFNLGVQLAQKEFLDKLDMLYKKYYGLSINGHEVKFAVFYMELKQSLGEKP